MNGLPGALRPQRVFRAALPFQGPMRRRQDSGAALILTSKEPQIGTPTARLAGLCHIPSDSRLLSMGMAKDPHWHEAFLRPQPGLHAAFRGNPNVEGL